MFSARVATLSPPCVFRHRVLTGSFPREALGLGPALSLVEDTSFVSSVPERKKNMFFFLLPNEFIEVFLFVLGLSWQLILTGQQIGRQLNFKLGIFS